MLIISPYSNKNNTNMQSKTAFGSKFFSSKKKYNIPPAKPLYRETPDKFKGKTPLGGRKIKSNPNYNTRPIKQLTMTQENAVERINFKDNLPAPFYDINKEIKNDAFIPNIELAKSSAEKYYLNENHEIHRVKPVILGYSAPEPAVSSLDNILKQREYLRRAIALINIGEPEEYIKATEKRPILILITPEEGFNKHPIIGDDILSILKKIGGHETEIKSIDEMFNNLSMDAESLQANQHSIEFSATTLKDTDTNMDAIKYRSTKVLKTNEKNHLRFETSQVAAKLKGMKSIFKQPKRHWKSLLRGK